MVRFVGFVTLVKSHLLGADYNLWEEFKNVERRPCS